MPRKNDNKGAQSDIQITGKRRQKRQPFNRVFSRARIAKAKVLYGYGLFGNEARAILNAMPGPVINTVQYYRYERRVLEECGIDPDSVRNTDIWPPMTNDRIELADTLLRRGYRGQAVLSRIKTLIGPKVTGSFYRLWQKQRLHELNLPSVPHKANDIEMSRNRSEEADRLFRLGFRDHHVREALQELSGPRLPVSAFRSWQHHRLKELGLPTGFAEPAMTKERSEEADRLLKAGHRGVTVARALQLLDGPELTERNFWSWQKRRLVELDLPARLPKSIRPPKLASGMQKLSLAKELALEEFRQGARGMAVYIDVFDGEASGISYQEFLEWQNKAVDRLKLPLPAGIIWSTDNDLNMNVERCREAERLMYSGTTGDRAWIHLREIKGATLHLEDYLRWEEQTFLVNAIRPAIFRDANLFPKMTSERVILATEMLQSGKRGGLIHEALNAIEGPELTRSFYEEWQKERLKSLNIKAKRSAPGVRASGKRMTTKAVSALMEQVHSAQIIDAFPYMTKERRTGFVSLQTLNLPTSEMLIVLNRMDGPSLSMEDYLAFARKFIPY